MHWPRLPNSRRYLDIESATDYPATTRHRAQNNKATYPRIYGLGPAKDKVQALYLEALESINYLGRNAQLLRDLTKYILMR